MRLFPFSLKDRAREWLQSCPIDSITTWEELATKFLARFYPPVRTARMRAEINNFCQYEGESLYESWERFKVMLRKCPHHGVPRWLLVQTFYNGLSSSNRTLVVAAAGGAINNKTEDDAYELIEQMSINNYQWPIGRLVQKKPPASVHGVDSVATLAAQVQNQSTQIQQHNA